MSQQESINNLLGFNRYDLYYDNIDKLDNTIDEIIEFGSITKYADWKKIIGFLTKGRYDFLNKNKNIILKLIDLLDDKFNIAEMEIDKIYSSINDYYHHHDNKNKNNNNINTNIRIKIYQRYGIVNTDHLIKLLDINNNENNKLNKFDDAFLKFIKKDNKKKQDYTITSINHFLNIIFNEDINSILINKDKTINNNIDTFINKFSMIDRLILLYDFAYFMQSSQITKIIDYFC